LDVELSDDADVSYLKHSSVLIANFNHADWNIISHNHKKQQHMNRINAKLLGIT
jgi:hypothetical protein